MPPAILLRFLREHRSEWADSGIDAYAASAVKAGPCSLQVSRAGNFGGQLILPLAHTIENEEANTSLFDHLGFNIFSFFVQKSLQFSVFQCHGIA